MPVSPICKVLVVVVGLMLNISAPEVEEAIVKSLVGVVVAMPTKPPAVANVLVAVVLMVVPVAVVQLMFVVVAVVIVEVAGAASHHAVIAPVVPEQMIPEAHAVEDT